LNVPKDTVSSRNGFNNVTIHHSEVHQADPSGRQPSVRLFLEWDRVRSGEYAGGGVPGKANDGLEGNCSAPLKKAKDKTLSIFISCNLEIIYNDYHTRIRYPTAKTQAFCIDKEDIKKR